MLESLVLVAAGWMMTPVVDVKAAVQVAADEAVLKNAGLKTDGQSLLGFFQRRTLTDPDRDSAGKLIRQLGSDSYRLREQALAELIGRGPAILELVRAATRDDNVEIARRAEKVLARIQDKDVPIEVLPAVVRLLTARRPSQAVATMLAYLPYADNDSIADETRDLLATLARRENKVDPALAAALTDPLPLRRAAAGEALTRAGLPDQLPAVRKLLGDADSYVRLRVAMALANYTRDKTAVPILIDTLPHIPLDQAWQAEDFLFRLAEGHASPAVSLGSQPAARAKCRDAWQAWWKANAAKVDLARLQEKPRLLGYTIVVLLDVGRVMELGANNVPRWQVDNLIFPLDVQYLPGDRLLIAEYHARRVTERNLKGEVLWEKEILGPLVAQRLPSGNTFIATDNRVFEVDRADKEVFAFSMADGERIMKAVKLPNGEIACLTDASRVVRFDTTGKELFSYEVSLGMRLFGGRIYMLPSGRVLIPHNAENKVVEYDSRGKAVWEVSIEQPVAAVRLPNGNTLVTTMTPARGVVEFDRNGQEVWTYHTSSRITRALRR
jgi:HEAT repeat protein